VYQTGTFQIVIYSVIIQWRCNGYG